MSLFGLIYGLTLMAEITFQDWLWDQQEKRLWQENRQSGLQHFLAQKRAWEKERLKEQKSFLAQKKNQNKIWDQERFQDLQNWIQSRYQWWWKLQQAQKFHLKNKRRSQASSWSQIQQLMALGLWPPSQRVPWDKRRWESRSHFSGKGSLDNWQNVTETENFLVPPPPPPPAPPPDLVDAQLMPPSTPPEAFLPPELEGADNDIPVEPPSNLLPPPIPPSLEE